MHALCTLQECNEKGCPRCSSGCHLRQLVDLRLMVAYPTLLSQTTHDLARRVAGLKRVTRVAVGEKHSLALQRWVVHPDIALPGSEILPPVTSPGMATRRCVAEDGEDAEGASWVAAVNSERTANVPGGRNVVGGYWERLEMATVACPNPLR